MPSWASYEAYLFDLDGTLIDTAPDLSDALNHCLRAVQLPPVDEALTRHWVGHGARVLISQALQHRTTEISVDAMLPEFLEYYRNNIAARSKIYPGAVQTLEQLRARGAKLAVVTNKISTLSLPLLEQTDMIDLFDLVVCGDTAAAPKPDPAPVDLCLQTFDIANAAALFVGDSDTDVKAAQAAGVAVVCVRDGYNHGVNVTTLGADGVIDLLGELLI